MKNLFIFLGVCCILLSTACMDKSKTQEVLAVADTEVASFSEEAELKAIMDVIDLETNCFFERDYDCWKAQWQMRSISPSPGIMPMERLTPMWVRQWLPSQKDIWKIILYRMGSHPAIRRSSGRTCRQNFTVQMWPTSCGSNTTAIWKARNLPSVRISASWKRLMEHGRS